MSFLRIRHLLLFVFILAGSALHGRNLEEIKRSGKIYVAFTDDDLRNINYDLALEFARYLNVELIEVRITWEEVFMRNGRIPEDLESNSELSYTPDALKKADIICSTFTINDWRKRLFGFAETLQSAELLMIRRNDILPRGLNELSGKKIACVGETTFEQHLQEINATMATEMEVVKTPSTRETQALLRAGKVYGIVLDADEALNFNASNGQSYQIAFPISDLSRTAWATEKNNPLIGEVENFFSTIANSGVLDELFYQRFGITYATYLERLGKNLRLDRVHRSLEEILASGKLVVAFRERNFIYSEKGQKQFMHILAEEFADYLGVELEFVVTPYFARYWETREGDIWRDSAYTPDWFNYFDLACETMTPLDWRNNKVNMIPIYPSQYTVIARKETEINSFDDLKALRGVTAKGTIYADMLRDNGIDNYYTNIVNNFLPDVASGKADYTIIYNAFYELPSYPDLEVKMELSKVQVSWAIRQDQPALEAEVRKFIERSQQQGLINTLLKALQGNTLQAPEAYIHSYYERFQTGQLPYVNYGADDGLPQEDIFAIYQDKKGYMWFGTNSGAVRYNGREMVVVNHLNGLPGNSVRDIAQDSSGLMLFATSNGIARFDGDTTVQTMLEGLAFSHIYIDSKNQPWYIGDNGLYMEKNRSMEFMNALYPSLPDRVYQICEDAGSGQLLLATAKGVFMLDPKEQTLARLSTHDAYSLFIDANDSLWISTRDGLYITHPNGLRKNGLLQNGRNLNKSLNFPIGIISEISSSEYGSVWLVSDSKIMQMTSTDEKPVVYEQEIGIKNNKILSFLIDQEDNLWIGFSGGLQRLTNRKGLRNFFPSSINSYIYSLVEDGEGRLWIASDNGVFHFRDGLLTPLKLPANLSPRKFCAGSLPDGRILLAHTEGLLFIDPKTLRIEKQIGFDRLTHSLENVFVSSKGEIFLLSGIHGTIYYLKQADAELQVLKNKYSENIFTLIEAEGEIIGGNGTGLVRFNGESFEPLARSDCNIWTLNKEGNRLWVGTDCGIGLIQDRNYEQMELHRFEEGLVIKSIVPARNRSYLWLGTNRGFSYFNIRSKELEFSVNTKDGLSGDEITPGGLLLDSNDLLWVGSYHGVSTFNIRAKSFRAYAPVCYIEKMLLNGEDTEPVADRKFSHKENNLVFEISALSFSDEHSVEYEYYLRGTGNKYSAYHRGSEYRAVFNNLPAGKYDFIYKARGKNKIWGYAEKYSFSIQKAWYDSWFFRLAAMALVILSAWFFYLCRIRKLKGRLKLLEETVRERDKALKPAHTEIGNRQKNRIQYIQKMQAALLPGSDGLQHHFRDHFLCFKPGTDAGRAFYWFSEQGSRIYIAVGNGKAQGLPGALMSIAGMSLLQDLLNKQARTKPGEILQHLHKQLPHTLQGPAAEGLDIVLCCYQKSEKKIQFAGTHIPLLLLHEGEWQVLKTDGMPIGISDNEEGITTLEADIGNGDSLYLFSEGHADQFGGPRAEKHSYRGLKDLLLELSRENMPGQGRRLEEAFLNRKGKPAQINDLVLIGLKF